MTDEQHTAQIKSFAEELNKLAHSKPLAPDPEDRDMDQVFSLGWLFRLVPCLCPHNTEVLERLVLALLDLQDKSREAHEPANEGRPTSATH